jgi:hypothetical protein
MEGDGIEEGYILEEGYALKIMGKTLKAVADTAGVARAAVVYEESGVNFADFCNDLTVDAAKVEKEFELSEILSGNPLKPVKGKIAELLAAEEGFEAADVATEMETAFDATIRASAEYVQEVGLAALNCAIPDAAKCDCDRPMEELDKFIPCSSPWCGVPTRTTRRDGRLPCCSPRRGSRTTPDIPPVCSPGCSRICTPGTWCASGPSFSGGTTPARPSRGRTRRCSRCRSTSWSSRPRRMRMRRSTSERRRVRMLLRMRMFCAVAPRTSSCRRARLDCE